MRLRRLILGVVVLSTLLSGCRADEPPFVIRDAILIDGTGSPPKPNITVVVVGNRITQVTRTQDVQVPASARVIEGNGLYVIPGLWDTHVHLSKAKAEALPVLIANGVTSVRDMGGDLDELRAWRDSISSRRIIGPRMLLAGPMLETPATLARTADNPSRERWTVTRVAVPDSAAARAAVDSIAALGVDFIKIREAVSNSVYSAIVDAAEQHGLAVAGHPPYSMDPVEAAALGLASFEHASYPYPLDTDAPRREEILDAFVQHDVAIVPTLAAWETHLMDRDSLLALVNDSLGHRDPRRRLISDFLAYEWRVDVEADQRKSDETLAGWQGFYNRQAVDLRTMHESGIPMLPGSDLAGPGLFPGYSLHRELALLVDLVGLTPMEAIESATRLPAERFGLEEVLGTVEVGKLADLVLLDADPLADISNSRSVVGVFADGRYFDSGALSQLLDGLSPATEGGIELLRRP